MNTNKKFTSILEIHQYFNNIDRCVKHLEKLRWNGDRACPYCGSAKTYVCKGKGKYKCGEKGCLQRFRVTTGTFFEATKLPLSKWFIAMYLCFSHKKGISSCQLARDLDISQKSAWFVLHRIRQLAISQDAKQIFSGMVEIDEAYIGGSEGNKHASKKKGIGVVGAKGGVLSDKKAVVGIIQRNGKVIALHVPNTRRENLEPFIHKNVKVGTRVITDEHYGYSHLPKRYIHETVKHTEKEYVVGDRHTNTIENFWSVLKRIIDGTYHQVSSEHLQKYVNEITFRFNTRKYEEQERFDKALSHCHGRLRWDDLIAKK